MLAARVCAQSYALSRDPDLAAAVRSAARFVVAMQAADGSWPYGLNPSQTWVDNFHTGYVLDSLDDCARCTGDDSFADAIKRGWHFYRQHFFAPPCIPKYFHDRTEPIDATAGAQALLTLSRFGDAATALHVADWLIEHMQCADGHFAYQIRRGRRIETPFMRWSTAYLFLGLSRVLFAVASSDMP